MAWSDRIAHTAESAWDSTIQRIDRAWHNASERWGHPVEDLIEAGGYLITHPWETFYYAYQFRQDLAEDAWQYMRDYWGDATQWWNAVNYIWDTPCEDEWLVLLKTGLPAVGNTLLLLIIPNPQEILEEYLTPAKEKAGRRETRDSDPTDRRRSPSGRKRRRWSVIPDVDGMIANRVPAREAVSGRRAGSLQRWLFTGIDIADRVAWYFMLADVSQSLMVNWTSNIMEARFCSDPLKALAIIHGSYEDSDQAVHLELGEPSPHTGGTLVGFEYGAGRIIYPTDKPGPVPTTAGSITLTVDIRTYFDSDASSASFDIEAFRNDGPAITPHFQQEWPKGDHTLTKSVSLPTGQWTSIRAACAAHIEQGFGVASLSGSLTLTPS